MNACDQAGLGKLRSVCLLCTGFGWGGAEMQVANLARGLRARGWRVHLVSLLPPAGVSARLRAEGFEIHSLGMRRGMPDPRALVRLRRLLRAWRPDVLHCHMIHANLLGRAVRLLVRVPVVVSTAHSIDEGGRLREWAYRLSDRLTDVTTNVSRAAVRRYIEVKAAPAHRIRCIPNGVDTSLFHTDDHTRVRMREHLALGEAFTWLAVGRLDPAKDYPTMLHAFARIAGKKKVRLLIVGEGALRTQCNALVEELGLDDRVVFLGRRDDVPDIMCASDAYVMSSAREGLPMVLLEAAAAGLPIVATDVGGNAETVTEGVSGFLCPSRDVDALAQRMAKMMSLGPATRQQMGQAARRLCLENYGMESILNQWESTYAEFHAVTSRTAYAGEDCA